MQKEYDVPFELTFNAESEVMNNLIVHDLSFQDEIVISENEIKYVFENDVYINLKYFRHIESLSENDKKDILTENPNAIIEDSEFITTVIKSNKPFKLVLESNVEQNDFGTSGMVFSTAYVTFP